jgi:hypothetical protein
MTPKERRRELVELTRKAVAMLGGRLIEGEADEAEDGAGEADTTDC